MFQFISSTGRAKIFGWMAIAAILFLSNGVMAGTLEHTIRTGPFEIQESPDGLEIRAANFGTLSIPGKPKVPYKIFAFALPPGAEVLSVVVDGGKAVTLEGTYQIAPAPAPRVIGPEDATLRKKDLETWKNNHDGVYNSDTPFPAQAGKFVRKAGFRKYNLVDVEITPFVYKPASGVLAYYPVITVQVNYTTPEDGLNNMVLDYSAEMERVAQDLIFNYKEAQNWYPPPQQMISKDIKDFVIITTTSLTGSVTPLVNWETAKGRIVEVVTVDWIYANYTGDDNAEKMRNFLRDKYPTAQWGIEDVLLVGHHTDVPMREAWQDLGYGRPRTDFYFAELSNPDSSSWDSNGNNRYAEDSDNMNYYAEVNVGRIPWSTPSTVQSICQKSVVYEQNNDPAFKKNILLLGAYFWSDTDNAVLMEAKVNQTWMSDWTMTRMYEKNSDYYSSYACDYELLHSNVMNVWPNGTFAFVNYAGHGSPTSCHIYGLGAPAFIQASDCPSLNDSYPAIVFSDACSNSDTGYTNIGMAMLEQGAVGFVGATEVALGCPGWNDPLDGSSQSMDYYFTTRVTSGNYTQGAAHQLGLSQVYQQGGWDYVNYEICQWTLWGNPDLLLGGDFPDMPNVSYVSHTSDDSSGNGDGIVDPGETIMMPVTLENTGTADATGVTATITTTTAGITINDDTAAYPDIPMDESRTSTAPHFSYTVQGTVALGTDIAFDIEVTTAEGTYLDSFTQVVGDEVTFFFDDMESGTNGWTHGGTYDEWTLGNPASSGSSTDPGSAYSPSNVWGIDLGADGDYQNNCNQWLDTPSIDCSDYNGVTLKYYRYLNVEKGQWDDARIYVNSNLVWENDYSSDHRDSSWQLHEIDISAYADGNASVTIRWQLGADTYIEFGGWNLDDAALTGFYAGGNHDPVLTSPSVTPATGYYGTRFEFKVHYYDADSDAPSVMQVNIDGANYDMTLDSGTPSDGTYHYFTRDIAQNEAHTYYFYGEEGMGGSARNPVGGTFSGPTSLDPELYWSGTPGAGQWLTLEVWGCVDALWAAAWSSQPGPHYVPVTGLFWDIGPADLRMAKRLTADPLHLDEYGYGSYDFRIPGNVSVGTKYIQAGTKMNAYWAKSNQESFEIE